MEDTNLKIAAFIEKYDNLSNELKAISGELNRDKILIEIEKLKNQDEQIRAVTKNLHQKIMDLTAENKKLKDAIAAQIMYERAAIIKSSKGRVSDYLESQSSLTERELTSVEADLNNRVLNLYAQANEEINIEHCNLAGQFSNLKTEVNVRLGRIRDHLNQNTANLKDQVDATYDSVNATPITEKDFNARTKKLSIEYRFGAHWFSWLGVILVLLGLITFAGYSYQMWLNSYGKSIGLFAVSVIFLFAGEIFMHKKMNLFAEGLVSLGIGSLYASTFLSYFVLHILLLPLALGISIGVSALSLILTRIHRSKTITVMALVGGYLPVLVYHFAIPSSAVSSIVLMVYILLLNTAMVTSSTYKDWNLVKYLSFTFGMFVYLLTINISSYTVINLSYSLMMFLMFTFIQIAYPVKRKSGRLVSGDIIILGLNTLITASTCYAVFRSSALLVHYTGLFSIGYALMFLALGIIVKKARKNDLKLPWLFYIASLTFFVLSVPFQLGYAWISLGWVAQGLLILAFGIKARKKVLEYYGWSVCLLSFFVFGQHSFAFVLESTNSVRCHLELLTFLVASIIILFIYYGTDIQKKYKQWEKTFLQVFKYCAIIYSFSYVISESHYLYTLLKYSTALQYLYAAFIAFVVLLYGVGLSKIKRIQDDGTNVLSYIMKIAFVILTVIYNAAFYVFPNRPEDSFILLLISFIIMLGMNTTAFIVLIRLLKKMLANNPVQQEIQSTLSGFFLIFASFLFIVRQFNWFKYNGFLVNFIFMLLALLFIAYGFRKRYTYIRRIGLCLSFFVCAKLFFIDLFSLDTLGKIISFFVIGVISLAISYSYQRINKKIEKEVENTNRL